MKVVISCEGRRLEDRVDPRFGRCQMFLLVDTDTLEVEAIPNDSATLSGGAGIQAAQLVADWGAGAVITGQLGPNAARVLESANVPVYIGANGSAREALETFKAGLLERAQGATVGAHFGMRGGGGGMGMGRGRGMGRGLGMGQGMRPPQSRQPNAQRSSPGQEQESDSVQELKRLKQELQSRMEEIQRRIEELEKR